jgi:hypothetical protein
MSYNSTVHLSILVWQRRCCRVVRGGRNVSDFGKLYSAVMLISKHFGSHCHFYEGLLWRLDGESLRKPLACSIHAFC